MLLWINFVSRLTMYCVSWTAMGDPVQARERALAQAQRVYREADAESALARPAEPSLPVAPPTVSPPVGSGAAPANPVRRVALTVSFAAGACTGALLHALHRVQRRGRATGRAAAGRR